MLDFTNAFSVAPAREEPAGTLADEVKDLLRGVNRTLFRSREESSRDGKVFCSCASLDFCLLEHLIRPPFFLRTYNQTDKQKTRVLVRGTLHRCAKDGSWSNRFSRPSCRARAGTRGNAKLVPPRTCGAFQWYFRWQRVNLRLRKLDGEAFRRMELVDLTKI